MSTGEVDLKDISISDIENMLLNVEAIHSVKINSLDKVVKEIHVLSDKTRSVKQIIRDIETMFAVVYHIEIDHKIISIVQLDRDLIKTDGNKPRLAIRNIEIHQSSGIKTLVKLAKGGEEYVGESTGVQTSRSQNFAAARACLSAVHEYLGYFGYFDVIDIQKMSIAGKESYSVAITYAGTSGESLLIGSAMVTESQHDAIIKATLDAINRTVSKLDAENTEQKVY